jgi:hypothetical protein
VDRAATGIAALCALCTVPEQRVKGGGGGCLTFLEITRGEKTPPMYTGGVSRYAKAAGESPESGP